MTRDELVPQIRKCWEYAKALGIGEAFTGPTVLDASDRFKTLAVDPNATYESLYLAGMHEGQYNILLSDLAFLQFGMGKTDGVRFAYYPNPFLGASSEAIAEIRDLQEYVNEGVVSVDELLHRIAEVRRPQHPPLVRYEFSKSQYIEATHPCSHLHLGFHAHNRWPLNRYLTANAFALIVFRIFYLDFWVKADPIKFGDAYQDLDTVLEAARIQCRLLLADEFSASEAKRFHFI